MKRLLIVGLIVGTTAALAGRLAELAACVVEGEILAHQLDQLFGLPVHHQSYQQDVGKPIRSR
jgi:hypothetical protein